MLIIWTVGLDDDKKEGLSAYSVFNQHCRAILGSIDVESLVNQYVGGNIGIAAGMGASPHRPQVGEQLVNPQGHQQQPQQQQQQENISRKSGKKARRGNLEQRRDRQLQRQNAGAMGFAADGGDMEQIAMQRLMDDAVIAGEGEGDQEHLFELDHHED